MNVFDFDKTIYDGNSGPEFFLFCLLRNIKLIRYAPKNLAWLIKYTLNPLNIKVDNFDCCLFLREIDDLDKYLNAFWKRHMHKIKSWYLEQKDESDIIVSSTPAFLLLPICKELNIKNLVATNIDKSSGELIGNLCFKKEKLIRFKEEFPNVEIDKFYTDSLNDQSLMEVAKTTYIVKGNKIKIYEKD